MADHIAAADALAWQPGRRRSVDDAIATGDPFDLEEILRTMREFGELLDVVITQIEAENLRAAVGDAGGPR